MHTKRVQHWKNRETKELFEAIMKLKNMEEAHMFFRDLCTSEEIDEMARRWQAAQMLAQERPYREVAREARLSTTTVARVAHWLNFGKGGYQLVLRRLKLI